MEESNKPETRMIHPRIPVDLHRRVTDYAHTTHRTTNGAIVALLEQALANRKPTCEEATQR